MCIMESNDTLPDDAWKDSFDKLLDQRPILRELYVIKRDVRASFNMNSSYENSNYDNSNVLRLEHEEHSKNLSTTDFLNNRQYIEVPKPVENKLGSHITKNIISTPYRSNSTSNPFQCALSPIQSWNLLHFKAKNQTKHNNSANKVFNATPKIDKDFINVEYSGENCSISEKPVNTNKESLELSPLALVQHKWKTKQNQKQVCFASTNTKKIDKSICHTKDTSGLEDSTISYIFNLPPGKWRKSLNYLRLQHLRQENEKNRKSEKLKFSNDQNTEEVDNLKSLINTANVAGKRKSIFIKPNSIQTRNGSRSTYSLECNDFKRQVLNRCGQRRILNFESVYSKEYLKNCRKIGEGAFGEVFLNSNQDNIEENIEKTVLKIIPIDGKELVNGEVQKTFEQILPEVIISMELCGLKNEKRETNITTGFVSLKKVRCVKGKYPDYLLKLWEEYDLENKSENDNPLCFPNNQKYIILEMGFSGQDLEAFQFKNAEQSYSALQQIILTLAVGEKEYQFEHRDLHWGNVLVLNTSQTYISYKVGEKTLTIPSRGVKISIIDYTLSRMTFNNYCFYNDLSTDEELFIATGDYQFEIYRMMRKVLNNKWDKFEPKTNIFWISYIISKFIEGVSYKNIRSKTHLHYMGKLKQLQKSILKYKSCLELAEHI